MGFDAPLARVLTQQAVPPAPTVEGLIEAFPAAQRLLYSQALNFASAKSPALQAFAFAQLWSLLREDLAAREDARIIVARLAAALGRPAHGLAVVSDDSTASLIHRQATAQVRAALRQTPERDLDAWAAGPGNIARAVVRQLGAVDLPWVGIGPSSSLAVLYGPMESYFSLNVLHPSDLQARFAGPMPRTGVLAEPELEANGAFKLLDAYAALPFTALLCVSRAAALPSIGGFSHAAFDIEVPVGVSLFLGDASYVQSAEFSPPPTAVRSISVTLHLWRRER